MKAGPLICAGLVAAVAVGRRRSVPAGMLVIAGIGVAGLCVYGSGLIELPRPEVMIRDAVRALGSFTYVLVGGLAFLETGAGVGLIAPGELVVILGGVSAGQGELSLLPLIALVWACALAGDLTSYVLGRRLGRDFLVRHGAPLGITEPRLAQGERFFAAHGGKTIVLGRFIGLVRALSPFIAGASKMDARRFVAYASLASGIWAATFCLLGYVFWQSLDQLLAATQQGTLTFAGVVGVVVAGVVIYRRRRRTPTGTPTGTGTGTRSRSRSAG